MLMAAGVRSDEAMFTGHRGGELESLLFQSDSFLGRQMCASSSQWGEIRVGSRQQPGTSGFFFSPCSPQGPITGSDVALLPWET